MENPSTFDPVQNPIANHSPKYLLTCAANLKRCSFTSNKDVLQDPGSNLGIHRLESGLIAALHTLLIDTR